MRLRPSLPVAPFAALTLLVMMAAVPPAAAAPIHFIAALDGPSESPPVASDGLGSAIVTIDPVAHTLFVSTTWSGLEAPTTVAHIHVINGPGDANTADTVGPVATATPTFPGFPAGVTAGSYAQLFDTTLASTYNVPSWITNSGGTVALAEAELFDAIIEGRAYLNIHTTFAPSGEIRGFLHVPEPSIVALLGTAVVMGATAAARARRRQD